MAVVLKASLENRPNFHDSDRAIGYTKTVIFGREDQAPDRENLARIRAI